MIRVTRAGVIEEDGPDFSAPRMTPAPSMPPARWPPVPMSMRWRPNGAPSGSPRGGPAAAPDRAFLGWVRARMLPKG